MLLSGGYCSHWHNLIEAFLIEEQNGNGKNAAMPPEVD
jgi:hypothetical protein